MSVYVLSQSGVGASVPYQFTSNPNIWQGSGVSLLVNFSGNPGGAAVGTASVQVTNDPNVLSPSPSISSTARWNNHDTLYNLTADKNSSIAYRILAVRINVTSWTSGAIVLQIGTNDQT